MPSKKTDDTRSTRELLAMIEVLGKKNAELASAVDHKDIFSISAQPTLVLLPDQPVFTIVDVNEAYLKVTGTNRTDLVGKGAFEAFPDNPADKNANGVRNLRKSLLTVIETAAPHRMPVQKYDIPVRGTDHFEERFWEVENAPVVDASGKIKYLVNTPIDVTEREKADLEMRLLVDNTDEGFVLINRELNIVSFNRLFHTLYLKYFGKKVKEGEAILDYVQPERRKLLRAVYEKALSGQEDTTEIAIPVPKSAGIIVHIKYKPAYNPAGEIIGVFVTVNDVTMQRKAEKTIKESEAEMVRKEKKYRSTLDKMLEGVQMYDHNWHCIYANDAVIRQGSYPRETILSRTLMENYPGIEETELFRIFEECIAEGEARHIEYEFAFPGGPKTWFELSLQPMPEGLFILSIDITERKRAENSIKDSEEKRRLIMNAALDAIICIDIDGRVTFWNPQAERIFGWKQEEVTGRVLSEIIIPEPYREMHNKGIANYLNNGRGPSLNVLLELSAIDRQGRQFPVELTILAIKQGGEEFFCAFIRDITVRRKSEDAIRASNERYNLVAKATNDSIWDWDLSTNEVVRDGKQLETFFGYEGWEAADVDRKWNELAHAEDWARVTKKRMAILADPSQNYWDDEYRFLRADGEYAYVYDRAYIIRDSEGKPVRLIGASQDISERKRSEEILKNSELRFRSLIEKGNEIIALHDADGKIIYVSPSVETLLGYKPEDLIGRLAVEGVHRDELSMITKTLADVINRPGSVVSGQWRHRHADGNWRWMEGVATNLLNDPAVNAVVHNFRDITAQKEAEEKVKEERNLLRTLIDIMPDAIYVKDAEARKLVSNRVDLAIMGALTEAEVIGKTDLELFATDPGKANYDIDMEVIRKGKASLRQEQRFITPEGTVMWLLTNKVPLRNDVGEVTGLVGIGTDITHLKQVEAELFLSNERFEYATKASFDAIWDWDLVTDSLYWGEGFEKLFGYTTGNEMLTIHSWDSHIHPDDVERVNAGIRNALHSSSNEWSDEYRFLKANGEYAYVLDNGIVIRDETGKGLRMIGAMQDNTIKKKEEQQLKLFESVITHTQDSILITEAAPLDGEGPRIVYVNDAFTEMTGYHREEVIGKTPRILQGAKTDRQELNKLRLSLEKWEPCQMEVVNYKKNGEEFWISISLVPVANEKGLYTHWIAVERDVTKPKLAEVKLKEKNDELKRLSAYLQNVREEERKYIAREVHDELGQLASALKIDVDWLGLKIAGLEDAARNRIAHANKTIEVLITTIRKIASSLRPSVLDDFGLNAALQWHCAEFQNLNGIPCIFEPGFNDENLPMDIKTELFRITQESLTNVMRHANAQSVVVRTGEDEGNYYLTITDTGIGFDTDQRKNTLGLIGLRERAISLNGKLQIESRAGEGTAISAVVPKK